MSECLKCVVMLYVIIFSVPNELHCNYHRSDNQGVQSKSRHVTWGSDGHSVDAGELLWGAHLDDDVPAALQAQVARRAGRRHVEGDAVVLGGDGQLVGAHFVGRVAVGDHAVSAHHHGCEREGTGAAETEEVTQTHWGCADQR